MYKFVGLTPIIDFIQHKTKVSCFYHNQFYPPRIKFIHQNIRALAFNSIGNIGFASTIDSTLSKIKTKAAL